MRRIPWLLVLMLLIPCSSSALQLRWSTGSTELSFTSATRCTLMVQADSAEGQIPAEWRLLWVADSSSIQFVAMDSLEACLLDEAQVSRIDGPVTAADSAANLITARFCSDGGYSATVAQQVVDLPAGGRGKLKAVALDPSDSTSVLESNEVTYNGGIDAGYPACILRASSTHRLGALSITVEGSGLANTQGLRVVAPDTSWQFPLNIVSRSASLVTAEGTLAAPLPPSTVEATVDGATIAAASLPADC
jgi:hypothetical protein